MILYAYSGHDLNVTIGEIADAFDSRIICLTPDDEIIHTYGKDFIERFDECVMSLFDIIIRELDGKVLPLLIEDTPQEIAFASRQYRLPVIGICSNLVYNTLTISHILSRGTSVHPSDVMMSYEPIEVITDYNDYERGDIPISADHSKRNLGNILAYVSLYFSILHESMHHYLSHLDKVDTKCLKSRGNQIANISNNELQKLEYEADLYALTRLMAEVYDICHYLKKYWDPNTTSLEAINVIFLSTLIALLDVDYQLDILSYGHPPVFIRCFHMEVLLTEFVLAHDTESQMPRIVDELIVLYTENIEFKNGVDERLADAINDGEIQNSTQDVVMEVENGNRDILFVLAFTYFLEIGSSFIVEYFRAKCSDLSMLIKIQKTLIEEYKYYEASGVKFDHDLTINVLVSTEPRDNME